MASPAPDPVDATLQTFFAKISAHLAAAPSDTEIVITEFNALVNKFDAEIKAGHKAPLPLVNPEFRPRVKSVREKIWEIIGHKMKIPDLRFEADRLSREAAIPLPNSTRKNNEALMQWFDVNWAALAPRLRQLRDK